MEKPKPSATDIIHVEITEDGIGSTITRGSEAAGFVARMCVAFLRELDHDQDHYAEYRSIKHPEGSGSATPESRLAAWQYAMQTATRLAYGYVIEVL